MAILGILVANITAFSHNQLAYYWPPALPGGATAGDDWIWVVQFTLIDGKMRGIFAILFGAGLVLFARKAGEIEVATQLQARRLFWLALFGFAHFALLFGGDILFTYAIAGMFALLALPYGARGLFVTGVLWAAVAALLRAGDFAPYAIMELQAMAGHAPDQYPALEAYWQGRVADIMNDARVLASGSYLDVVAQRISTGADEAGLAVRLNFYETIPQMLIGMGLFKAGLFTDPALRRRWRGWAWGGAIIGAALLLATAITLMRMGFPPYLTQFAYFALALLFNLPLLLGGILLLTQWADRSDATWLGERLRLAGRMAFTNYILTSFVMMLIFQGWAGGLFGTLHRIELLPVVALGWAIMLTVSRFWLSRFRYGPLEWLWRCLTYWRIFDIRRTH
ncbi:DUF418 domain-containing protein [Aurantiacibacter spongiae]|uniref:DUF418 domain-containing protein n=1 Tax=Aurantiacibacter spongiae TaxID=2488860 RepID=A0A3N5CS57_9SPHN|nr:DUF418 domain-containing protein [Aurantiacibacter spongiae]RPF71954.1 DUF418 domain-containing protein [Aurantiacibacter spongiae]